MAGRILFVAHIAYPSTLGGACKSLLSMVEGISGKYQPVVACPNEGMLSAALRSKGIPVQIAGKPVWGFLHPSSGAAGEAYLAAVKHGAEDGFRRAIQQVKPSVVHVNSIVNPVEALTAKKMGVPVVWHVREILPRYPGSSAVLRLVHDTADHVLVISRAVERAFLEEGLSSKITLLYNGFQVPPLPSAGPGQHPVVGYVGSLAPHKGLEHLLHIAVLVVRGIPGVKLVIAGDDWGTGYKKKLVGLAVKLGLKDTMSFLGFCNRVEEVMANVAVLAVPSVFAEPFGRVAAEGMLLGKPVVASPVGGLKEVVVDGVTGWLALAQNHQEFAERILALLKNPVQAREMGLRGRQRAVSLFSLEDKVETLDRIYRGLSGSGK